MIPTISSDQAVQAFYARLRKRGESHAIAEMLAFQRAPGANTDTGLLANFGTLDKQLGINTPWMVRRAKKQGYIPAPSDVYVPSIARFPGDARAFVKQHEARAKIKAVLEVEGGSACGLVNGDFTDKRPPAKKVKLRENIVQDEIEYRIMKNPSQALRDRRELREQVMEEHAPKS